MEARATKDLLQKLTEITQRNLAAGEAFAALDDGALHLRPRHQVAQNGAAPDDRPRTDAWNVLDCLAHLNHYGDYYLPEIRRQIKATMYRVNTDTFTSSWLGNYFAASMKPGPKTRKVKTFKTANPTNFASTPDRTTITEFLRQQKEMLELLQLAAKVDLTKTKTGISITKLVKLRLGDTLRVVVYHNWRHVEQAQRACNSAVTT